MIVSNALPIQFWINGVPTFNEKVNPGVQSVPYYQKFQLSDVIRLQVLNPDDEETLVKLCAYDCDGVRVATQDFTAYDGYYEITFTFSTLGLAAGAYRLQIETPYILAAGTGVLSINGQDAALGGKFGIAANMGAFVINGQSVTFTIRHGVLNLQGELYEAFGAQQFYVSFAGGPSLTLIGNGATDADLMEYDTSVEVFVGKVTNGGIAQEAGVVNFVRNGVIHGIPFNVGDNISSLTPYTFVGLAPSDVLLIQIYEL